MKMSSCVILLSGGLDSLVALDIVSKKYNKIKNPDHIISGTKIIIPAE